MKDIKYWLLIGIVAVIFFVFEYAIGDVIIDSQTNTISPLSKVFVVLIVSAVLSLVFLAWLRGRLNDRDSNQLQRGRPRQTHRAVSIIPIVRAALIAVILILVVLVALSEFGVQVGPLLAGAGIFGVVLGMGAQSLLKDILAGVFYIIDDAFRIGEYVETGTIRGTVENISLRSMQIRHHRGALYTVPYGTITSISNLSRDWVIVKLMFQLPLDTDVIQVKKIVKSVSATFMEEEQFAPFILEPLKFQGIDNVDLNGLMVRLKFMAVPGEQFVMRREMLRRLQHAFANNGIEFAKRNVTVNSTDPAAIAAADQDEESNATQSQPSA